MRREAGTSDSRHYDNANDRGCFGRCTPLGLRLEGSSAARALATALALALSAGSAGAEQTSSNVDALEHGRWSILVAASAFREAWDYNLSREDLFGGTVAVAYAVTDRSGVGLEAGVHRVTQTTIQDVWLFGGSVLLRWRAYRGETSSILLEGTFGPSYATNHVPARGTRFNYLVQTGLTVTRRLGSAPSLAAGVRWLHLSNNSLAGRDRNPDIQALGVHLGVLLPLGR